MRFEEVKTWASSIMAPAVELDDDRGDDKVDDKGDDKVEDKGDDKGEVVGAQEITANAHTSQAAVRQPLGESDLPCSCPRRSFAEPPEQLPMPATKRKAPAPEAWI